MLNTELLFIHCRMVLESIFGPISAINYGYVKLKLFFGGQFCNFVKLRGVNTLVTTPTALVMPLVPSVTPLLPHYHALRILVMPLAANQAPRAFWHAPRGFITPQGPFPWFILLLCGLITSFDSSFCPWMVFLGFF